MHDYYATVMEGEPLPYVDGRCGVWESAVPCVKLAARDAITNEFAKFYEKSVLYGAPSRKPAERYFIASANRMANFLDEKEYANAISLLRSIASDHNHEMIKTLEHVTKVNWSSNEKNRIWLVELLNGLATLLEIKQRFLSLRH
ncbi:hypothetical protein D3871_13730 [Noviherbaspirillum saxi]|uniref:Uncharacterized protein n=2 Tax=Noviherbaspirillum saxi TaxID=2320863 RepID=A0A3A3FTC0_9BURK|nr:hypothetical protein D3871_13730 [Noviherbaspirillum saxi]